MGRFEDVRERIFQFVLRIMKLCNYLTKTESNKVIINQLLRASTSIGANLEEAAGAHTKQEFIYCLNISKKESRETNYWLRLLSESVKNKMKLLITEGEEIVKILSASVKSAKMAKISN